MKRLYKFMFILAFLQGAIVLVNAMSIFPYTFYDTAEVDYINDANNLPTAEEWFVSMFAPDIGFSVPIVDALSILVIFLGIGVVGGVAMQGSFIPVVISFQGYMIFTMIVNSRKFLDKMLLSWGSQPMIYVVLLLGLGIILLFLVTILETTSHSNKDD